VIIVRAIFAAFLVLWAAGLYVQGIATESKDRWLMYVGALVLGTGAMVVIGWK
jgi:hypothetical protein